MSLAVAYEELFYSQKLDHFNPQSHTRWDHRYLISQEFWDGSGVLSNGCRGPILLYAGNEGDITAFWESNGFMIDYLAPKWGALLVFPEERYYGKSLPFGNSSLEAGNLVYLTTSQVLEDYVELISYLKDSLEGAASCPVVAFGGSYGGTLVTYLRAAYPAAVAGGLAASAELGYYDLSGWAAHGVDEFTFSDIVTRDYADADPLCLDAIAAAAVAINTADQASAAAAFHVCEPAGLGPTSQADLFFYALESLPQSDYPYEVFLRGAW
jgi:pimeloyl-ACP methyl ester carboxylesterase